jgi:hypothetical protein
MMSHFEEARAPIWTEPRGMAQSRKQSTGLLGRRDYQAGNPSIKQKNMLEALFLRQ